jgi:hypothetical protein
MRYLASRGPLFEPFASRLLEVHYANLASGMFRLIALIQVCGIHEMYALPLQLARTTVNVPEEMHLWLLAPDGIEQLGASEMCLVRRGLIENA